MSGLISSYFIEPVVRQARRFGNNPANEDGNDNTGLGPEAEGIYGDVTYNDLTPTIAVKDGNTSPLSADPSRKDVSLSTVPPSSSHSLSARRHHRLATNSKGNQSPSDHQHLSSKDQSSFYNVLFGRSLYDRFAPLLNPVPLLSTTTAPTDIATSLVPSWAITATSAASALAQPTPIPIPGSSSSSADSPARGTAMPNTPLSNSLPTRSIQAIRILSDRSTIRSISQLQPPFYPHTPTLPSSLPNAQPTFKSTSSPLPEDDGQSQLRQKIVALWKMDLSPDEKSRRLHNIMNERFHASELGSRYAMVSTPPGDHALHARTSSSSAAHACSGPLANYSAFVPTTVFDPSNPFNVLPADLIPSHRPEQLDAPSMPGTPYEPDHDSKPVEPEHELGCLHYKRNVKVQCFACKTWWPCRLCHDEAGLGHTLPRHLTENMLCMFCKTPGPAGQYCKHCSVRAAHYYCEVCKLWDDSNRSIYHCADCGICRLGEGIGKDYEHCKKCNVCIPIGHTTSHKCIERALECDCPICSDYMFSSSESAVSLPCGHYLHKSCYDEYIARAYQCPVCKKSAINMELHWRKLEDEIISQPMPARWQGTIVELRCNDCGGKSRCLYHWLGCRCGHCDSFNTVEMEIIGRNGELHDDAASSITTTSAATAASPNSLHGTSPRSRTLPRHASRYFQEDDSSETDGLSSLLADGRTSAFDMLSRMTRSLSPLRRYFDPGETSSTNPEGGAATESELEAIGFWGDEADEDDEDDYEDEDEGDFGDDDDDSDDDRGVVGNFSLIGHP